MMNIPIFGLFLLSSTWWLSQMVTRPEAPVLRQWLSPTSFPPSTNHSYWPNEMAWQLGGAQEPHQWHHSTQAGKTPVQKIGRGTQMP